VAANEVGSAVMDSEARIALPDHIPDKALEKAWTRRYQRYAGSRNRILFCSDVRYNRISVTLPEIVATEDGDEEQWLRHVSPDRKTLELRFVQTLADNEITVERAPIGTSDTAESDADDLEMWCDEARKSIVPVRGLWGKAVEDGEWAVSCIPRMESYLATPTPYDLLTEEEWKALDEKKQADWELDDKHQERNEDGLWVKLPKAKRMKMPYWRDKDGRPSDDDEYTHRRKSKNGRDLAPRLFKRDKDMTEQAYKDAVLAHLCEQFPVAVRIIPATDCIPYLVQGVGKDRFECRGLIERQLLEKDDLIGMGYRWHNQDSIVEPNGFDINRTEGNNGQLYLYTAYLMLRNPDTDQYDPCLVYSVAGMETTTSDEERAPVYRNLRERYGLSQLPVWYGYGAHTESDNPDERGVPMLDPLAHDILNREGLITSYLAHTWRYAFSKLGTQVQKDIPASAWLAADMKTPLTLDDDGNIIVLPGPTGPLMPPPVGDGVRDLLAVLKGEQDENSPSPAASGQGGGDQSGHALSLTKSFVLAASSDIMEGVSRCVEWIMETALEICDALEKKFGIRVPVWVTQELPAGEDGRQKVQLKALELNPRWLGSSDGKKPNVRLTAVYQKIGNLVEIEQVASLAERGFATFEDVMKARGKKSPSTEWVKIMADRIKSSPEGQLLAMIRVYRRRGDEERAQKADMVLAQEMTKAGMPVDALAEELRAVADPAAGGAAGPVPGMVPAGVGQTAGNVGPTQLQDVAASSLAGTISGAMGSASRMADSQATVAAGMPVGAP
jgi:hypothetical protein